MDMDWKPPDEERVLGWINTKQSYTSSGLVPTNVGEKLSEIIRKDPRKHYLEPGSADSQCNDSGCGVKPTDTHNNICYICGFDINQAGNSGVQSITACKSNKEGGPTSPLEDCSDPPLKEEDAYKAFREIRYKEVNPSTGKNTGPWKKKLEPFYGLMVDGEPAKKGAGRKPKKCCKSITARARQPGVKCGPTKWASKKCDESGGKSPNCKTKYRLYRKNAEAAACGSQCEHILPILTLAFLLGLNMTKFKTTIEGVWGICKFRQLERDFNTWQRKLYGHELPAEQDATDPKTEPGTVYLWAHPYCNILKSDNSFVDIDFDLSGTVQASVNSSNIDYILQVIGGFYLDPKNKDKILRKNWWKCIEQQTHNPSWIDGDNTQLTQAWYTTNKGRLTQQMNNLVDNINEANTVQDQKRLNKYVAVCIMAVHRLVTAKTTELEKQAGVSSSDLSKKLQFCDHMDTIFHDATELAMPGGGQLGGGTIMVDGAMAVDILMNKPTITCPIPGTLKRQLSSGKNVSGTVEGGVMNVLQVIDEELNSREANAMDMHQSGGGGREVNENWALVRAQVREQVRGQVREAMIDMDDPTSLLSKRLESGLQNAQNTSSNVDENDSSERMKDEPNPHELCALCERSYPSKDMKQYITKARLKGGGKRRRTHEELADDVDDGVDDDGTSRSKRQHIGEGEREEEGEGEAATGSVGEGEKVCLSCYNLSIKEGVSPIIIDDKEGDVWVNSEIYDQPNNIDEIFVANFSYDVSILNKAYGLVPAGVRGSVSYKKKKKKSTKKKKKPRRKQRRKPCRTVRECKKKLSSLKNKLKKLTRKKKKGSRKKNK